MSSINAWAGGKWIISGIVEAPVEAVFEVLLEAHLHRTGGRRASMPLPGSASNQNVTSLDGAAQHNTASVDEGARTPMDVEVERERHSIAVQGRSWYRGVHSVEPHERGSLLVHSVYNLAPRSVRWLVFLAQFRSRSRMRASFKRLLDCIGDELGCATKLSAKK